MSSALKDVELCPVCGLPPEYCEYGGKFDLCKPWLKENHLDLYPDLASLEVTDEMSAATLEAINAREALVGTNSLRFWRLGPKRKDPKKMKKEKILTFTLKTRQKHKHMTSVAGLELFGLPFCSAVPYRCGHQDCYEGFWKEVLQRSICWEECGESHGNHGAGRDYAGSWSSV